MVVPVGVVTVGSGAVCVCCRLDAAGEVATIVSSLALERSASQKADAAPAAAATTSARSAGQTQSPGYQPNFRRHAEPSDPTSPVRGGSLAPHSRQYSCPSSWGVSQRAQRCSTSPSATR